MASPTTLQIPDPPNASMSDERAWRDWFRSFVKYARTAVSAVILPSGYLKGDGTTTEFTAVTSIPSTDITGLGNMSTQSASAVAITGGSISGVIGLTTSDISGLGTIATQTASSVNITGTVKAGSVGAFISSDNSTGYTGTVTTATLVGKTITIKDGIITGFA